MFVYKIYVYKEVRISLQFTSQLSVTFISKMIQWIWDKESDAFRRSPTTNLLANKMQQVTLLKSFIKAQWGQRIPNSSYNAIAPSAGHSYSLHTMANSLHKQKKEKKY